MKRLVVILCGLLLACGSMESAKHSGAAGPLPDGAPAETTAKTAPAQAYALGDDAGLDDDMAPADEPMAEDAADLPPEADPRAEAEEAAKTREQKPTKKEELATTLYLSADDSNSQASPVVVRSRIRQGLIVDPSMVRTYEFLNYYTFDYPAAKEDSVGIFPELRKSREDGQYSLQVAVRGEDRGRKDVLPLSFTFVIDVSGSMAGQPSEMIREFMGQFLELLKTNDRLSVVVCNRQARLVVDSWKYDETKLAEVRKKILATLARPDDITDLHKGIELAYQVARKNYQEEFLNRVVLLSDGATNAGKLSIEAIAKHSRDSEERGIYLVGVGFGEGFNDSLMNAFTDAGKGAYLFVNDKTDVERALGNGFTANFDIAVKDVRLKMVMPPGWSMIEFHGEQVSTVKSEVVPQHLSPNDQMIYHQIVGSTREPAAFVGQEFVFEAEFREAVSNKLKTVSRRIKVKDMLAQDFAQISKGDAVVAFAEALKEVELPLWAHHDDNLKRYDERLAEVVAAANDSDDAELAEILALMRSYRTVVDMGPNLNSLDKSSAEIGHALGLGENSLLETEVRGANPRVAVKVLKQLGDSTQLVPREGYRFLAIGTGPVGAAQTKGGGKLSSSKFDDPVPEFMGGRKTPSSATVRIHDLHQVTLTLKAPSYARSFSFDFNYFSAEYPEYVKQNYNDTFYAIIEADSTNDGDSTNISFDANHRSIEVDNNYFQNPFHPVSNHGTGYHNGGSTSWLRTSWPIKGGEEFTLTFSVHDEGDEIYDSLVVLDNFRWHDYESVGNTDPLN